jgi:hypothetical protein
LLERIFERAARAAGGRKLHPLEILSSVERACVASARDGVVANRVVVSFSPMDFSVYEPAFPQLRREIGSLLDGLERRMAYRRIGKRLLILGKSSDTPEGQVSVVAEFADTDRRPQPARRPAVTERIQLHRGVAIVFRDGTRIPLDHTPFTVGRSSGNDFVLLNPTVSGEHARIIHSANGFVIEDQGSRNGVVAGGTSQERVWLAPGRHVWLGDVELWLEGGG